jgi:hypothetical protein
MRRASPVTADVIVVCGNWCTALPFLKNDGIVAMIMGDARCVSNDAPATPRSEFQIWIPRKFQIEFSIVRSFLKSIPS